ncbi:MAG: hypothetical protein AABO41_18865, partial [Acidobacteriota bacterium]
AATLSCDTNGDGIAETTVALVNVTPVSCNLIRATIPVSASFGTTSTSGFPAACCGGAGTITVTTTFTSGDNNAFGPFTRTFTCALALGTRAPVVLSVTPSSGSCSVLQDLLISGACFIINGVPSVTSVFAIDRADPARRIDAAPFTVLSPFLIDAFFNFTSANAGRTFLIFVQGPGGISRNLLALPAGSPTPCTTGNEQGIQVTFTCSTSTGGGCPSDVAAPGCPCPVGVAPGTNGCTPLDIAVVNGCDLKRDSTTGAFSLDVVGRNIKRGAIVTIGSVTPKKIKFREADSGFPGAFIRITLKKGICGALPGNIVVTNPSPGPGVPAVPSQAFRCNDFCPTN